MGRGGVNNNGARPASGQLDPEIGNTPPPSIISPDGGGGGPPCTTGAEYATLGGIPIGIGNS